MNYIYVDTSPKRPAQPHDLERAEKLRRFCYPDDLNRKGISSEELIQLLKEIPALEDYYELYSGVGEGFTVEQQTLLGLKVFDEEFSNFSEQYKNDLVDIYLYGNSSFDKPFFKLMLALCNIGKGLNYFQGHGNSKEQELKTTCEIIDRKAEWMSLDYSQEMQAFLQSDIIGDFLKQPFTEESLQKALCKITDISKSNRKDKVIIINNLILLHQITASRYEFVRKRFFKTVDNAFVSYNNMELPKLYRNRDADTPEEFLDSAYCDAYQEKIRALRHALSLDAKKMLLGEQSFNSKELIDVISQIAELRDAYAKSAGVGERYTIKQHTQMMLDVFLKEMSPLQNTQKILSEMGLTKEVFCFFLALHDIGKGIALEKFSRQDNFKELELKTTRDLILKYADELNIEKYLPLFDALLSCDCVGDFLKKRQVTEKDCEELINKLVDVAYEAKVPVKPFFELFVLFHQCDASSYPFVRNKFFTTNPEKTISLGHVQYLPSLQGEGDAVYSQANREKMALLRTHLEERMQYDETVWTKQFAEFDLSHPQNMTLEQVEKMISVRKSWKLQMALSAVDRKKNPTYQALRVQFKRILNYKLPTRLLQGLKKIEPNLFVLESKIHYLLPNYEKATDKNYRRNILPKLMRFSKHIEDRLKFLEQITVVHGSNSAALAMMILSGSLQLQCTGHLRQMGLAPMSGELRDGISAYGVNNQNLSACTLADVKRSIGYTQSEFHYNHAEILEKLKKADMNELLKEKEWGSTGVYLLQLRQWDDASFKESFKTEELLPILEKYRAETVKPLETLLKIIDHHFTEEEIESIKKFIFAEGEVPDVLKLFLSEQEIKEWNFGNDMYKGEVLKSELLYCRYGSRTFKNTIDGVLKTKIDCNESQDLTEARALFSNELQKIEGNYQYIRDALTLETPKVVIPKDNNVIREAIEHPIPVLFASTSYIPKAHPNAAEFAITEPTNLGKGGFDLIFTDTKESQEKIRALLPENLREEIEIHLFDELQVPIPLYHNPQQVRPA